MIDQQDESSGSIGTGNIRTPVPAARPLSDFSMERVGDDIVLYDASLSRYHTLNGVAFDVWRLCDGSRSIEQVGLLLERSDMADDVVGAAVAQLGESGLLVAPEQEFEASMHRRKMVKLVAAGAIGAVGIPVVASISRMGPEASATCGGPGANCVNTGDCNGNGKACGEGGHGKCVDCVCDCR